MSIQILIKELAQELLPVYEHHETAMDNAWWIIESLTGLRKTELISNKEFTLSGEQKKTLTLWLKKLVDERMPLQYLIGTVPFLHLELHVKPPILIPRPETEAWVADLIYTLQQRQKTPTHILDLCTGSGCIALALAQAFPRSNVYASDINPEALALAQENARKNKIKNIHFREGDLFKIFSEHPQLATVDLIVSNPPYIDTQEWEQLAPEVKLWEDRKALVAPDKGTGLIKLIIEQAADFLVPAGLLYIEIGHQQGPFVEALFKKRGFEQVEILRDLYGKERVVKGIWKVH